MRSALLLLAVLLLAGCTPARSAPPDLGPVPVPADTSAITSDGGSLDQLADATLADLRSYWGQTFPRVFDELWTDLSAVHSVGPGSRRVPCGADLAGPALYCAASDAVVWDRALLPELRQRFGDAAVVVVLAHEVGHAVHTRLGVGRLGVGRLGVGRLGVEEVPTILTEAMADCYTGAFARWVADGNADRIRLDPRSLDGALGTLVSFRDPVGTAPGIDPATAHGGAFGRVSSFQDGYERGPALCARFTVDGRNLVRSGEVDPEVRDDVLFRALARDLPPYFDGVVERRGGRWEAPVLRQIATTPDCSGDQGPVALCPGTGIVQVGRTPALDRVHREAGDHAAAVLVASRYALAALRALDVPVTESGAGLSAICLVGAWDRESLRDGALSFRDLDEAVEVLLALDAPARDIRGQGTTTGFERIAAYRSGVTDGCQ